MNKVMLIIGLILSGPAAAVNTSTKGTGEVLLFPYYTVNGGFNTQYQIFNNSGDAKALKVKFLEGQNSRSMLIFNVYLAPFDVWTGHLSATTSTIAGHQGESSVLHSSSDPSCSPFLNTLGQEFLPFEIDQDAPNNSLERGTEGHIEVIEMGTLTGNSAQAVMHNSSGLPGDCDALESAWLNGGYWQQNVDADMGPASGGLLGSATLLNVSGGQATGYQALALEDFWQANEMHTEPGDSHPNLGHAFPESNFWVNGAMVTTSWTSGALAVSSVLMQHQVVNEFNLQAHINGRSEWVINFPTKYLHVSDPRLPPFTQQWDGSQACELITSTVWDAAQNHEPRTVHQACYSVNVAEFMPAGSRSGTPSNLLGSTSNFVIETPNNLTELDLGWGQIGLAAGNHSLDLPNDQLLMGLPVTGFAVQSYINAGAPQGVLAQYMGLHAHTGFAAATDDLIFKDGFNQD